MKLHFKKKTCVVLCSCLLIPMLFLGQGVKSSEKADRLEMWGLQLGYQLPLTLNSDKNYNAGMAYDRGIDIKIYGNFWFTDNFLKHLQIGLYYNILKGDVVAKDLMGNYEETNVTSFGFLAGYGVQLNRKFQFSLQVGLGYVNYKNINGPSEFKDSGGSYTVTPQFNYVATNWLKFFIAGEYRFDNIDMKAPEINGRDMTKSVFFAPTIGIVIH